MDKNLKKFISIQCGLKDNDLFKNNRKWIANFTKDDQNEGFVQLRNELKKINILINTDDFYNHQQEPDLEIHFVKTYKKKYNCKQYLLLPESIEIIKENNINLLKKFYDKIFCQFDDFIDNKKVFKLYYPYDLNIQKEIIKFKDKKFACILTSNKNLKSYASNNLYPLRYKLIKWFEKNHKERLHCYGLDWHLPMKKTGYLGRALNFLNRLGLHKIYYKAPKNYYGLVDSKIQTLKNYKFTFCFENCSINGYISDPIFDAINARSVPIYFGAKNINMYIPEDCFINFSKFKSFDNLYSYLNDIDTDRYEKYLKSAYNFYNSIKSNVFKKEYFVSSLIKNIKSDLS